MIDEESLQLLQYIGTLAQQQGVKAYLVGGPVRDLMLKRPNTDLDITVEGNAMRLAESFTTQCPGAKLVYYPAFKTATLSLLGGGRLVDFATARKETYSKPGAFPKVMPSTIKDDLHRRDFTINAMAISINPKSWGKLVDLFGGKSDLGSKKIRVLHAKSFLDDPTRILRAARFKTRFGFALEKGTLKLLREAVAAGALDTIKPQRYKKEFDKILKEEKSQQAIKCLKSWNAYLVVSK